MEIIYHFLFKLKRTILLSLFFLSPFSKVIPRLNDPLCSNVFLTDAECIKRCYESEVSHSGSVTNFMSSKHESVYVDNCANCHISNTKEHFIDYTPYTDSELGDFVNTIDGNTKPEGFGTVCWSWRDDTGKVSRYELPGCRHYPNSPVCILSQSQLGIFLKNDNFGTKIESGIHTSIFH